MSTSIEKQLLNLLHEVRDTGPSANTEDMIDHWVNSGIRRVVGMLPAQLCTQFTNTVGADSNPLQPISDRLVAVWREDANGRDIPCIRVSPDKRIFDANSIHQATQFNPRFRMIEGTIEIAPEPTALELGKVECIVAPSVDASQENHINGMDAPLEEAVLYFALHLALIRETGTSMQKLFNEIADIEDLGYINDYLNATPSYISPTLGAMPTVSLPTLTMPSDLTIGSISLVGIDPPEDLTIAGATATPPADLSLGTIDLTGITAPTMDALPSAPTYSDPGAFTWSDAAIDDALTKAQELIDTTVGINFEEWVGSDDVEQAQVIVAGANQEVGRAATGLQVQIGKLREWQAEVQESINKYQSDVQQYSAQVQAIIADFRGELEKYATEIRSKVEVYQSEQGLKVQDWQNRVQKYISEVQAEQGDQAQEIQDWSNRLQKYVSEVQEKLNVYQAETTAQIQDWQNKVQAALGEYQSKTSTLLQEYQVDIQKTLNTFQAELSAETSEFQANMTKARSHLEAAQTVLQAGQQVVATAQMSARHSTEMYQLGERQVMNYIRARGYNVGEAE